MFDRIEMDVINVPLEILLVSDGVLPEPALPKRGFAVPMADGGDTRLREGGCEAALDQLPAG